MTLPRARRFLLQTTLGLAALAGTYACSSDDKARTADDDVTSVENTGVRSQAIANCWLYATAGWIESLHKGATTRDVDLSEAYWNYWYWYEQITGGDLRTKSNDGEELVQGGWWGLGVELVERYGWMYEGDFIPATDARAKRHEEAVAAIEASLASGPLASPAARKDPRVVRAELDRAWKLDGVVVEDMLRQFPISAPPEADDAGQLALDFGPAPQRSITERARAGSLGLTRIHAPQELQVIAADGAHEVPLSEVLGARAPGSHPQDGKRVGAEAWSEIPYTFTDPGDPRRRALLKNVVATLNRRLAVPMAWAIASNAKDGVYPTAGLSAWSFSGLHESILVDYEADVPGFGKLPVDVRETRPAALEAALDDAAKFYFFRIKNSWGTDPVWTEEEMRQYGMSPDADGGGAAKPNFLPQKPGFNDIEPGYLDFDLSYWGGAERPGTRAMWAVALPNALRFPLDAPSTLDAGAPQDDAGAPSPADASAPDVDGGVGKKK